MSFWEQRGLDGFTPIERRFYQELWETSETLKQGRSEAAAQNRQVIDKLGEASAKLEDVRAATESATRAVVSELHATREAIVDAIEGLGSKIDNLADRIDRRLIELIEAMHAGFAELISQFHTVNAQLSRLIEILESPAEIRAIEQMKAGLLAFHNSLWPEARQRFTAATEHFDLMPVPWLYLGKIAFYVEGDLAEADGFFVKAVRYGRLRARDAVFAAHGLIHRAFVAFLNKDKGECIAHVKEALRLAPTNINVLVLASKCLLVVGQRDEAAHVLCYAFDLYPPTVLELAEEWTDPIQKICADWLAKQHGKEFEPILRVQNELSNIQRTAESKGFSFREWTEFPSGNRLFDQMSRGFLDLRLNGIRFLDGTKSLTQSVKSAMQSAIEARRSELRDYKRALLLGSEEGLVVLAALTAVFSLLFVPIVDPDIILRLGLLGGIIKGIGNVLWFGIILITVGMFIAPSARAVAGGVVFVGLICYGLFYLLKQWGLVEIAAIAGPAILLIMGIIALARKGVASTERKNLRDQLARAESALNPLIARLRELADRAIANLIMSISNATARPTFRPPTATTPLAKSLMFAKMGALIWIGRAAQPAKDESFFPQDSRIRTTIRNSRRRR